MKKKLIGTKQDNYGMSETLFIQKKKSSTNASEKKHKTPNGDKRQNVKDELSKPYHLLFISQR